jgi:hypothetical protein
MRSTIGVFGRNETNLRGFTFSCHIPFVRPPYSHPFHPLRTSLRFDKTEAPLGKWRRMGRHRETRNAKLESESKEKKVHQSRRKGKQEFLTLPPSVLFCRFRFRDSRFEFRDVFQKPSHLLTFPHISSHRPPGKTLVSLCVQGLRGRRG